MNNRFKFRVWNKLSNIMTHNFMMGNFFQKSLEDYEKKDWIGLNYEPEYICFINEAIENLILMQCTGLKDKNGKLIYEGDIVRFKNNITINGSKTHIAVIEHNEVFNAFLYHAECIGFYIVNKAQNKKFDVEVIGNIYENPELLQECE